MVMVFIDTFNNISVISWQSVLLVEETRVPGEYHRPVVHKSSIKVGKQICPVMGQCPLVNVEMFWLLYVKS